MGARGEQEGLAHFWVAVLRPSWLPWKNCKILTKIISPKCFQFNKVRPLKVVLQRINMRKHWIFSIIPQMFDSDLIIHICLFVWKQETNKSLRENLWYHWHYFDSPRKVQRRFAEFNSFRFSDSEAFNFRFDMLLCEQLQKVLEIQTRVWVYVERYFQASVSRWTWPPLPRYQGTRIAYRLWWRTYPAALLLI